jgi:hypothetical protein
VNGEVGDVPLYHVVEIVLLHELARRGYLVVAKAVDRVWHPLGEHLADFLLTLLLGE